MRADERKDIRKTTRNFIFRVTKPKCPLLFAGTRTPNPASSRNDHGVLCCCLLCLRVVANFPIRKTSTFNLFISSRQGLPLRSASYSTTMKAILSYLLALVAIPSFLVQIIHGSPTEVERLEQFFARNHSWPVRQFQPNTPGWDKLMRHRLRQVEEIEDRQGRFEGYVQLMGAGLTQPNFTEYGFGLARAPDELMEALRQGIHDGLAKGPREEYYIEAIEGLRPWFIDRPDLTQRVLKELHDLPEAWAGVELTPELAYGFRLYRNESRLHVHIDRPKTHVISFILHIDSSEDAEPWPILVEDFHGNSHEVVLTSGDILFYESSKCFHGRPRKFIGSWYSSVFVHYYPKHGYKETFDDWSSVYALPPHWDQVPASHFEIPLKMHGTAYEEPDCPNGWCATEYSKKWSGPAEEGYFIDPTGAKIPLAPQKEACIDKDQSCSSYLEKNSEECDANPRYMLQHCAKSCRVCTPDNHDEL
jgi:hypothetical protein